MPTSTIASTRLSVWKRGILLVSFSICLIAIAIFAYWQSTASQSKAIVPAQATATARVQENYGQVPLHFEANQGQFSDSVKYLTRGKGYSFALTAQEVVMELQGKNTVRVSMKLKGANPRPQISAQQQLEGKVNYFLGSDPKQWKTAVPTFGQVKYEQVYPGTDVVYYGNQQQLEYDFIVAPHADPKAIKLTFEGAKDLRLDEAGNLLLATEAGEVRQHKPIVYQEIAGQRREVAGRYTIENNEVGFALGDYDREQTLVIDPVLAYATFLTLGGVNDINIAVDGAGNAYLVGQSGTEWWNAPPLQTFPSGAGANGRGAYIAKLNRDGTKVLYLTVVGGVTPVQTERDCYDSSNNLVRCKTPMLFNQAYDVAVDESGNAYVTGDTTSADFPTTANAFQKTYPYSVIVNNGRDTLSQKAAFALKLNAAGTLTYATLLGVNSEGSAIAVDANRQMVIAGRVFGELPVKNAFQSTMPGVSNAFVTKLNAAGTELIFSTYLGSGSGEDVKGIALDQEGNAYVTGGTSNGWGLGPLGRGARFPITPGAYGATEDKLSGIFVTKFDTTGNVIYSTQLGGSSAGCGIAVDSQGCAYIAGRVSEEAGYPITPGAYQAKKAAKNWESVITKINADGSDLVYSTYFGKAGVETTPGGIAVDAEGNAYFANNRRYESARGNIVTDTDVVKLSADGTAVLSSFEVRRAETKNIARDANGNIYLTGVAVSGFPVTLNAYRPYLSGAFVAKITDVIPPRLSTYTIAGTVIWDAVASRGSVFPGVKVLLVGAITRSTIADDNGNYRFDRVPAGGDYYVLADPTLYKSRGEQIIPIKNLDSHKVINLQVRDAYTPRTTIANVSAASYQNGPLAVESIVSVFGGNLTTLTKAASTVPLPTELGGTRVIVTDIIGIEREAPLFFVSPTQVNYLIPAGTATGAAIVRVYAPDGNFAAQVIQVDSVTPGVFTADSTGKGIAAANVQRVKPNGAQSFENITRFDSTRGQMMPIPIDLGPAGDQVYLVLYGTGVRYRRALANASATVGDITASVTYAGSQNSYAGLDQINVMIPRELAGRGEVEVILNVEGKPANVVKVKIK